MKQIGFGALATVTAVLLDIPQLLLPRIPRRLTIAPSRLIIVRL